MQADVTISLIVAVGILVLFMVLLLYGISLYSVMDLADYDSWSEPIGYAILITFTLLTFSFFQIRIFDGDVRVYLNLTGVVVPVAVSVYLAAKRKLMLSRAIIATVVVAISTFFLVTVRNGTVVIDFPLWFVPAFAAVALSYCLTESKDPLEMAALAYFSGSMGSFLGGDLLKIATTNAQGYREIYFGANGLMDFVFLFGIIAVATLWGASLVFDWLRAHPFPSR